MRKMFNDVSQFIKTTTREVGGNASTIQMLRPSNTTSALGRPNHGLYFYRNTQKSGIVSCKSTFPHTPSLYCLSFLFGLFSAPELEYSLFSLPIGAILKNIMSGTTTCQQLLLWDQNFSHKTNMAAKHPFPSLKLSSTIHFEGRVSFLNHLCCC